MIQFSDQEMTNERLTLDSPTEVYYLGHNLTLRSCTLEIKVPRRALVVAHTRFIECTLLAKRELKNFRWESAHLQGCTFTGRFSGNDFGSWPDWPEKGSIQNCDFSAARLDECRFLGCDVATLRFPRWPCFTILHPYARHRELTKYPWPGDIGRIDAKFWAETPATTVAMTYWAPDLAKRSGTTPEAIKAVLEKLEGVSY